MKGPVMDLKKKFEDAKSKIKKHAPEIIAFAAATAGVIATVKMIKQNGTSTEGPKALVIWDNEGNGFPEVTGNEKQNVLGAENTILNRIDAQNFILTLIETTDN